MSKNSGARDVAGNTIVPSGRARGNVARDISGVRCNISGAEVCLSRGTELDSEIRKECPDANTMLLWPEASSALTLSRAILHEICRHPAGTCQMPLCACPFSGPPSQTRFSTCDLTNPEATPRSVSVVATEGFGLSTDTASARY